MDITKAAAFAQKYYGIKGIIKRLPGEEDYNFYIKNEDGQEYTLKISRPNTDIQIIDFQAAILNHLAQSNIPLDLPEVILSRDGKEYIELGNKQFLRLQKWVVGRMLSKTNPRSPKLLKDWGKTCGLLSTHLKNFDHPTAHRFYKWNPSETLFSKKYQPYIQGETALEIGNYFWDLFETEAQPYLPTLRTSVNYNDAHEHNLLTNFHLEKPEITGVIDFGDALFTQTINELAIACAYASMYSPDPLQAAANVVQGYHEKFPLEAKELAVLFPLINARLMITVANAAWNKHNEPDNKYLIISEKPAWDLLKKFRMISPAFAHYTFRAACALEPCPKMPIFYKWLNSQKEQLASIVDFEQHQIASLDLSVGSLDLGNNSNFENIQNFQKTIIRLLEDKNATIGIGGYAEIRPIYTTDAYKVEGLNGAQWRTLHLGIDVWAEAGTSIFTPLDGIVYSIQNNANNRDYGPTIILEHKISDDLTFYTLYGHLSLDSLEGINEGMFIKQGGAFAKIGLPPVNGNWPTHLHFQIILDMLGKKGDFPGVAFPNEKKTWLSLSPDPSLFFRNIST